jgi:hypothetical protein
MTPQQQEFWAGLTNNYEYFARLDSPRTFTHRLGQALQGKDEDTTTQVLNHCFPIIMRRRLAKLDRILMMKCWLTEYGLLVAPTRMIWFDQFHKSHGLLIKKHTNKWDHLDFSG